jgi:hypothetical protein
LDESDINCEKILKEVYELTQESYNEFWFINKNISLSNLKK